MEKEETESKIELEGLNEASSDVDPPMSKNQLKKLKKREKWLSIKQEKRRNAKLKRKHRLAEMRENGEDIGPTRKSLKLKTMKNSACKIRVVVDLSLDEYMGEKDVNSLTCQLQHSYAANRRAENPMQLYFCGMGGKTKERLDRIGDYKGWDIYTENEPFEKIFPTESLVYLSSESSNVLTNLSEDKVYVIGGLVDHNNHKGLCHRLAEEKGIAHAQLPISDYLDMKTRKVLTVNQVFSILLRYTETKDWKTSFLAEVPQRKNVNLKKVSSPQNTTSTSADKPDSSGDQVFESIDNNEPSASLDASDGCDEIKSGSTVEADTGNLEKGDNVNTDEANEKESADIGVKGSESLNEKAVSAPEDECR
ncbi:hypothetical protein EGW08_006655 [Elysia chlorotica]|uniref:tRNA (guanine(9)-N(1))-methyltransferase n=1 Tax=Elysia chlorotica TaxID=188477 RepID=A0A433TVL0_ELYCH|nr:hypothetical protein EGW08_006655 [Elysia chlorotica]